MASTRFPLAAAGVSVAAPERPRPAGPVLSPSASYFTHPSSESFVRSSGFGFCNVWLVGLPFRLKVGTSITTDTAARSAAPLMLYLMWITMIAPLVGG